MLPANMITSLLHSVIAEDVLVAAICWQAATCWPKAPSRSEPA